MEEAQTARSQGRHEVGKSFFFHTSIALFYISIGLIVGYLCSNSGPTLSSYGINPAAFIPETIFSERHEVIFQPDYDYIGISVVADAHWRRLLGEPYEASQTDLVFVENPANYGLQTLDRRYGDQFFVLAPLRQLRCLDTIRKQLGKEHRSNSSTADYCVEYLRLNVMCGEYWTVEPHIPVADGKELYTTEFGWGMTHSCIDWEQLDRWRKSRIKLAQDDIE